MATEIPPPADLTLLSTAVAAPSPDPSLHDQPTTTINNPSKRQRRPSVRLGEIGGDPAFDTHFRRPHKTWRFHKDPSFASKSSKIRPLTNLVSDSGVGDEDTLFQVTDDGSHRKPKTRRPIKRARTSWNNKFESSLNLGGDLVESNNVFQEDNRNDNEFREFEHEGSESPLLKEQQSPVNSVENMGLQFWDEQRKANRVRGAESNGGLHYEVNEVSIGIKEWLNGLGLRKYAPVFEIHEVDDDVLPMLTLEDLKDMGINAVGSRRKLYSAILKLRKELS